MRLNDMSGAKWAYSGKVFLLTSGPVRLIVIVASTAEACEPFEIDAFQATDCPAATVSGAET